MTTQHGTASPSATAGIVTRASPYSVADSLERIEAEIARRGLTVFARFDHSAAARSVDLTMPETCVLVFGNPRAGTPVMMASPLIALELPLRILVWSDASGVVFVSYHDPEFIATRYRVPQSLVGNIGAARALVDSALG